MNRRTGPLSLSAQVALLTAVRTVVNVAYRMVYPLLPAFGRGLGVDIGALSLALTARSLAGVAGVGLAPLADRYGRRLSMALGMALFSLGLTLVAFWPSLTTFVLALILPNLGMQVFIPAMQAHLADRVPYQRLGRALGITELSWALSALIGIPLVAWLIERSGWNAPFPWLAALGFLSLAAVWFWMPADRPSSAQANGGRLWSAFGLVFSSRMAVIAIAFSLLTTTANEIINFIFGVWMEDSFALQVAALGAAAALIGVAELIGSGGSAWFTDLLGKRRSVALGAGLNALAALLLPLAGQAGLAWAAAALFFFYLTYEFLLVSSLPLMSGVLPAARATMLALVIASFAGGRALGDLISPLLYANGFWMNAAACAVLNLAGLYLLVHIRPVETEEQVTGQPV